MAVHSVESKERLRLVRDSAAALVPRERGPQRIRALRFQPPGHDRALWRQMCELGWVGLRVPEEEGGSGLDAAAFCAIAEELGAALCPEPLIAAVAAAQRLSGPWLAQALAGDSLVVPAWLEQPHGLDAGGETRLQGGRLSGRKRMVVGGAAADAFVVATRDGLALVKRDAPGVQLRSIGLQDGGFAAELVFEQAPADALAGGLEAPLEEAALAGAAYLLGCGQAAFDITLAYLGMRKQFGKAIGSFQALQHRAVDMKIQLELARAVIQEAASAIDDGASTEARQALVSRARLRAADAAMLVGRESVQFHGAMGMTDECDIGLYARKIFTVQNDWGSVIAHRRRFAILEEARHA